LFHDAEHGVVAFEEVMMLIFSGNMLIDYVLGIRVVYFKFDSIVPFPAV